MAAIGHGEDDMAQIENGVALLDERTAKLRLLLLAGWAGTMVTTLTTLAELGGLVTVNNDPENIGSTIVILISLVMVLLNIATIIYFGMWIYRAAQNAVDADHPLHDSPGWAVGWYFIPFANLFKPFSAMRQIWNASHGETDLDAPETLLNQWWAAWLVASIASGIAFQISLRSADESALRMTLILTLVACIADLFLFPLAIRMTRAINQAQQSGLSAARIFE